VLVARRVCWGGSANGVGKVGIITVVNKRMCVWIIRGGCKPNDVVKRVNFVPCHFYTSVSNFRMFGHMLCYRISALVTNNAVVGFNFQKFDGECRRVADCFDDADFLKGCGGCSRCVILGI